MPKDKDRALHVVMILDTQSISENGGEYTEIRLMTIKGNCNFWVTINGCLRADDLVNVAVVSALNNNPETIELFRRSSGSRKSAEFRKIVGFRQ